MKELRTALMLAFCIGGCANLTAGPIFLPSDVSVALTAEPSVNLQSGERIAFTISITNRGPEPVTRLALGSSPIYDELDVNSASIDCGYQLVLAAVDLEDSFFYIYIWYAVWPDDPIDVGETRDCHLSLDFTPWAPSVFPVAFDMSVFDDLDNSNNSATEFLRRPVAVAAPVPTLSPIWLGLLVCLLMATAGIRRTQSNARPRPRPRPRPLARHDMTETDA